MKEYFPKDKLFEKLAAIEHERWADWQKHLHSLCKKVQKEYSGAFDTYELTISAEDVMRWKRQINTHYKDLSEEEMDSDRKQVMRYWHLIKNN